MQSKTGVLLVNLGTPNSPMNKDVYRYLIEFLTDKRVMDLPWLKRQLLVRGVIVPSRYRQSAKAYQQIWTKDGSPLMVYSRKVQQLLQIALGKEFKVELAMRYQQPSIQEGIDSLLKESIDHLIILPLFPQYASASTGSVNQKVLEILSGYQVIPKITLINQFSTHPGFIDAFCTLSKPYNIETYDHIIFSFHGLPERHLLKADNNGKCLKSMDCCSSITSSNKDCYSAQCFATANAISKKLHIPKEKFTVSFQSRLGKDPWIQPYTSSLIQKLAKLQKKRVLVFCPAFVCDCLETIFEIGVEYAEEFKHAGGECLDLVPGLNDHPAWIEALRIIILDSCSNKLSNAL
jgi:protoporphyrin/coproporphyrin ferrochelatase